MIRRMNSSNIGTVKAVSPWLGLQIMPLSINWLRVGAREVTQRPTSLAMSAPYPNNPISACTAARVSEKSGNNSSGSIFRSSSRGL